MTEREPNLPTDVPVLIIGGGPVGLCTAILLAHQGVPSHLVDRDGAWERAYGVDRDGAVLVRPDGHVAWRCPTSVPHPKKELERVLSSVLGSAAASRLPVPPGAPAS